MTDVSPRRLLDEIVNTRTMRSTSSTVEDVRRARDIRSRTVVLRLDPAGKPYSRLDVAHGLMQTGVFKDSFKEVEGLGPLSRNAEWYLTVSSHETKEKLLAETVTVNGKNGHFAPAGTSEYRARVHWLPQWVSSKCLLEALKAYNLEVVQITTDRSTVSFNKDHCMRDSAITVRSLLIKTDKIDNIPHLIKVRDTGFNEVHDALITVPRRPPLCLRCRQVGHIRGKCVAPFCAKCHGFGHRELECQLAKGSYAQAAGSKTPAPRAEDADMDEEVIRQVSITEKMEVAPLPSEKGEAGPVAEPNPSDGSGVKEGVGDAEAVGEEPATVMSTASPASQPTEPPRQSGASPVKSMPSIPLSSSPPQAESVGEGSDIDRPGVFTVTTGTPPPRSSSWGDLAVLVQDMEAEGWKTASPPRRRRREKRRRELSLSRRGQSLSPAPSSKRK